MTADDAPITRRQRRLTHERTDRTTWFPHRLRTRARTAARASRGLLPPMALVLSPGAVAILAGALVAGGLTQIHLERTEREQASATAALVQLADERRERSDEAQADRLTAQALAYASEQRTEALGLAREAVQQADVVATSAETVVSPEEITPLDTAVAELAELIEASPEPLDIAALTAADPAASTTSVPVPHDTLTALLDQPSRSTDDARAPLPLADAGATQPSAKPTTEPSAETTTKARPTAVPTATPTAQPTTRPSAAAASADPAPRTASPEVPTGADVLDDAAAHEALTELDLDTSAALVAAAQQVIALSAEVKATTDATIAAAEAAALAAAEAAAAEAAAEKAELERKVAVAADAPNGSIPTEVLCDVSFDSEVLLRCDAAEALEPLNDAYRAHFGTDLEIVSSYRSYGAQVATKRSRGSLAAAPGTSNHGRGLAVDLGGFGGLGHFGSPRYLWMSANAEEFGWHHPDYMKPGGSGPQEPWHWEFGTR